ncbi:MAG: LLM class flavin-dependent oxidoreductase [Acidimicrobiales bacterium]
MGEPECWTNTYLDPRSAARDARAIEDAGFDGVAVVDNQGIVPDPFVVLGQAAEGTTRLGLATGTCNPETRHASALAGAAATVAAASGNRMTLGLGRGLSANWEIGRPPTPLREFERYLTAVCGYLRGRKVDENGVDASLKWLRAFGAPQVPVEVTATGQKVIACSALIADRLAFAVGADPDRVRWAVDTARLARKAAGLEPNGIGYGAYVQAYPHPDVGRAVALARGPVSGLASLSGRSENDGAGQSDADRQEFLRLNQGYDRRRHTFSSSPQALAMSDEFVARFAALGPVSEVVGRLQAILDSGVTRLYLSFPAADADPTDAAESQHLLATQVVPALRSYGSTQS